MTDLKTEKQRDIEEKVFKLLTDYINECINEDKEFLARVNKIGDLSLFCTKVASKVIILNLTLFKSTGMEDETIESIAKQIYSLIQDTVNNFIKSDESNFKFEKYSIN